MLVFEGEGHAGRCEGNFEDCEADRIRRLGPDGRFQAPAVAAAACWLPENGRAGAAFTLADAETGETACLRLYTLDLCPFLRTCLY